MKRLFIIAIVAFLMSVLIIPQDSFARRTKSTPDSEFYLKEHHFDGNQYIGVPRSPRIEKEITITCFFKPEKEAFKSGATLICRWMETAGYQSYNLCLTEDYHIKIWLEIKAEDSKINHNVGLTLANSGKSDEWQHLAVTFDGRDIKAYFNGVLESDKIFSGELVSPKAPDLLIGAKESFVDFTKGNLYKGEMREIHVYNRSLTGEEIKKLFEEGNPLKGEHKNEQ